jgi:hypothetical protein
MQIAEADYRHLVARIKKLEKTGRVWKSVGLLVLLTLGLSLTANVTAQQKIQEELVHATTVEAQTFLLSDATGRVMGRLTVKDAQPSLEIYDATGKLTWPAKSRPNPGGAK